mmetsp:Transcript_20510/g.66481  ORF Transcript_20510/g.66481 Transcript_20510/m.66481 type:complete len:246 (-) Transcript_20510:58-795(-)
MAPDGLYMVPSKSMSRALTLSSTYSGDCGCSPASAEMPAAAGACPGGAAASPAGQHAAGAVVPGEPHHPHPSGSTRLTDGRNPTTGRAGGAGAGGGFLSSRGASRPGNHLDERSAGRSEVSWGLEAEPRGAPEGWEMMSSSSSLSLESTVSLQRDNCAARRAREREEALLSSRSVPRNVPRPLDTRTLGIAGCHIAAQAMRDSTSCLTACAAAVISASFPSLPGRSASATAARTARAACSTSMAA